jgi:hypothetical protein
MDRKNEIKLLIFGLILVAVILAIIWAIQTRKINPSAKSAHPASLSLSPSLGDLEKDQVYQIKIMIDSQHLKSSGAKVIIHFNPAAVEIIDQDSLQEGIQNKTSSLYPLFFENLADPQTGIIRVTATKKKDSLPITLNFPSPLAFIQFRPKIIGQIEFNFQFEKDQTRDSNIFEDLGESGEQDVLSKVVNAIYNVRESF